MTGTPTTLRAVLSSPEGKKLTVPYRIVAVAGGPYDRPTVSILNFIEKRPVSLAFVLVLCILSWKAGPILEGVAQLVSCFR